MNDAVEALLIGPYRTRYETIKNNMEDNQRRLELINNLSLQLSTPEIDSLVSRVQKQVTSKQTNVTEKQRAYAEQSKATYNWVNDLFNVFIIIFVTLIVLYGLLSIFIKPSTGQQQQVSGYVTFWDMMTQPFVRKDEASSTNKELDSLKDELTRLKTTKELNELKSELAKKKPSGWFNWF